ncbi:molybdopterin-dependent oxidoreductase, partial [Nitratifractor sp.]|uniref:molybdopterin-containing oxidoreductase family protein n=1 Tax=Nitratifractor sp. TaxID=2268144 RepID=UPI0025FD5A5F
LIATPGHPYGNGALCALLNKHFPEAPRIQMPRVDGREVSMEEALDAVAEALKAPNPLLWRGSGNLGVMQEVTNLLIAELGGTLTRGSLCDGSGQAGILEGRGINRQLPPEQIANAEVIVVWGRNLPVTNAHLMPFIEGKKLVVIDPVHTTLARKADLHIPIKPRSDVYLALLLSRFLTMEDTQHDEWLEQWGPEFDEFYDFTRSFRIKALLEYMGLALDDIGDLLTYLQRDRVVFLVGGGVQKYSIGHYTLWAIDSLAATLGLFGREGCGVSFLGNSRQGFDNPFRVTTPTVPIVATPFERFETVLVQGGNPAASMPDSQRVQANLERVKNLIYFGLYENESSSLARIVIPAKSFLEKNDLRLSYGHQYVTEMPRCLESEIGISEYDFTAELFGRLGLSGLRSEKEYLRHWIAQCRQEEGRLVLPDYEPLPYAEGFGEEGGEEFTFMDDFDDDFEDTRRFRKARKTKPKEEEITEFWLLSPKQSHSLNTQFRRKEIVHLPPTLGIAEGERVRIVSEIGSVELTATIDVRLRPDCVLIPAGTPGVNRLTPPILSEEGDGACYQEVKVRVVRSEEPRVF